MKTDFRLLLLSAIALTGATTFTACSSTEEDDKPVNNVITADDYGKGVVTQFALNLSSKGTRTTPAIVQDGSNDFRGMDNIYLLPLDFAQGKKNDDYTLSSTITINSKDVAVKGPNTSFNNDYLHIGYKTIIYNLGSINEKTLSASQSSKVYSLTLPVGTSNFLFYGKAPKETGSDAAEKLHNNFLYGSLTGTSISSATKANEIEFSPNKIAAQTSDYETPEGQLTTILNSIESANYTLSGGGAVQWRTAQASTDVNLSTLKEAYQRFVTVGDNNVRAGSAEAVRATVQELYRTVLAQSREGQSVDAMKMAVAVRKAIEDKFDVYFSTVEGGTWNFDWTTDATTSLTAAYTTDGLVSTDASEQSGKIDDFTGNYADGTQKFKYNYYSAFLKYKSAYAAVQQFPISIGLPAGAARLKVTETSGGTHQFSYLNDDTRITTGINSGNKVSDIVFPAELSYFANSALRATVNNKEVKDYPVTTTTWDDPNDTKWTNWDQEFINSDTRAVAMKNNVNYSVALLKSQVKLGSNSALDDNRKAVLNDGVSEDQSISIDGNSFIMTGILIGGQPSKVGWDFLPTSEETYEKIVYDRLLSKNGTNGEYDIIAYPEEAYVKSTTKNYSFVTTAGTQHNYTILLDNYKQTSGDQIDQVAVAIELVNNTGHEFYGSDGIVPVGGTFYLAGKLKLDEGGSISWNYTTANNDYEDRFPAYNVYRIFTQDHTTVATFTLSENALKNAYSTIPDLRSIQMLFGLSVDLKWEDGLEFDVEL